MPAESMSDKQGAAAYGGTGWTPRETSLRQEIGSLWGTCGVASEWTTLRAVLLHRPGAELRSSTNPDAVSMLAPLDVERAQKQHDALTDAYRAADVAVHYIDPEKPPSPNLMFVADLVFMTPEGAILGRPASRIRAGEERWVACRLAALGIPILCSIRGSGTFEGADAAWVDSGTVLLATGLRTNPEGAGQAQAVLEAMGIDVIRVGLPYGAMHLMGTLRFASSDLAIARRGRVPFDAVQALRDREIAVHFAPDDREVVEGLALNVVTLGPGRVLMPSGNPTTQAFYEGLGVACETLATDELHKAAGGIGCLTGVLQREDPPAG